MPRSAEARVTRAPEQPHARGRRQTATHSTRECPCDRTHRRRTARRRLATRDPPAAQPADHWNSQFRILSLGKQGSHGSANARLVGSAMRPSSRTVLSAQHSLPPFAAEERRDSLCSCLLGCRCCFAPMTRVASKIPSEFRFPGEQLSFSEHFRPFLTPR